MNRCPDRRTLRRWSHGQLSASRTDELGEHVEACSECQRCLADSVDELIPLDHSGRSADYDEVEIQRAVERFRQANQSVDPQNLDIGREVSAGSPGDSRDRAVLGLKVRCPHCHAAVETRVEDDLQTLVCQSCGSGFNLLSRGESTQQARPLRQIGHFEIIELLGAGTFGSVWKARDTELERTVAIKMPRKEQLDPSEAESFLHEARAAARIKHPHVVQVYEVGRDEDRIYIVSDFVRGVGLHEWMKLYPTSERQAAALLVQLADAVHAAHECGVVHRDLKPANILMDVSGQPFITDFGMAKRSTGDPTVTCDGEIIGTLAYMPPEQARGDSACADRRSDVYSLGAILFQLLTHELPFRGSPQMLIFQILKDEAPSPRQFNARVSRDLETLCLKCLQKEPEQRFQTAAELAADLRRFLADEPVVARPIGKLVRMVRWYKRRPVVAGLATALTLILIAVSIGASVASMVFQRQRTAARELAAANAQLAQREKESRQLAEKNLAVARDTVKQYFEQVSNSELLNQPGLQDLRRHLLDLAAKNYEQIAANAGHDTRSRIDVANAYGYLAEIQLMIDAPQKAASSIEQAQSIFEQLNTHDPDNVEIQEGLGSAYFMHGDYSCRAGKYEESEALLDKSLEIRRQLVKREPANVEYRRKLSSTLNARSIAQSRSGNLNGAKQSLLEAIDVLQTLDADSRETAAIRRHLASFEFNLALIHRDQNQMERANELFKQSRTLREALVKQYPDVMDYQRDLVFTYGEYAGFQQFVLQDLAAAESSYLKGIEIAKSLYEENPNVLEYRRMFATLSNNLAQLLGQTGRTEQAIQTIDLAIQQWHRLVDVESESADYRQALGDALGAKADLIRANGQIEESQPVFESVRELYDQVANSNPNLPVTKFKAISLDLEIITNDNLLGRFESALTRTTQVLGTLGLVRQQFPSFTLFGSGWDDCEANAMSARGFALSMLQRHDEAVAAYSRSLELTKPDQRAYMDLVRATALARKGDYSTALEVAHQREQDGNLDGAAAYELSRIYTLAADSEAADSKRENGEPDQSSDDSIRHACELIRQAKQLGYFDDRLNARCLLELHSDFKSLRESHVPSRRSRFRSNRGQIRIARKITCEFNPICIGLAPTA